MGAGFAKKHASDRLLVSLKSFRCSFYYSSFLLYYCVVIVFGVAIDHDTKSLCEQVTATQLPVTAKKPPPSHAKAVIAIEAPPCAHVYAPRVKVL